MVKIKVKHWGSGKGIVYESYYTNIIKASGIDTVVAQRILREWGGIFGIDYFEFPDEKTASMFLLRWT